MPEVCQPPSTPRIRELEFFSSGIVVDRTGREIVGGHPIPAAVIVDRSRRVLEAGLKTLSMSSNFVGPRVVRFQRESSYPSCQLRL